MYSQSEKDIVIKLMEMSILISILIINILFIISSSSNILISSYTLPENISSVIDLLESALLFKNLFAKK